MGRRLAAGAALAMTGLLAGCSSGGGDADLKTVDGVVKTTCGLVALIPDDGFDLKDKVAVDRVSAATTMAMLAADMDPGRQPLSEAVRAISVSMSQTYNGKAPQVVQAIKAAKTQCAK